MTDTRADPVAAFLAATPVMILDGALATELQRRGADLNDPLWSAKLLIENPALISAVHLDYLRAGADVVTTASYQATFGGFARRGIDTRAAADLMRTSVALAVDAREAFWADVRNRAGRTWPLVAASIGPYGALLADGAEYRGHYGLTVEALMDFHRPRLQVLASAGADLLACETIPCLREALALARLLQEFPAAHAWISFSCRDGGHNNEGEDVADCVRELNGFDQIAGIGVNCTAPGFVTSLMQRMRANTDTPLVAYPNSGEPYDPVTKQWGGRLAATAFASKVLDWHAAGARLIGGCCRTTPKDIRVMRATLTGLASLSVMT